MTDEPEDDLDIDTFTAAEIATVAAAIDAAEDLANRVEYLSTAKMPCPECGGSGSVDAGSLGGVCLGCMGARYLDHPASGMDAENPAVLRVRSMRGNLQLYCRELTDYRKALDCGEERDAPPRSLVASLQEVNEAVLQLATAAVGLPSTPVAPPAFPHTPTELEKLGLLEPADDFDFSDNDEDGSL